MQPLHNGSVKNIGLGSPRFTARCGSARYLDQIVLVPVLSRQAMRRGGGPGLLEHHAVLVNTGVASAFFPLGVAVEERIVVIRLLVEPPKLRTEARPPVAQVDPGVALAKASELLVSLPVPSRTGTYRVGRQVDSPA